MLPLGLEDRWCIGSIIPGSCWYEPGSALPTVCLVVVGVLRGGIGLGCIVFGELHVSAVWILQAVAEGINRPPPPSSSFLSSGMGLFTEAVLWLMFVCVRHLFICLANKCIINKPLPHVILQRLCILCRRWWLVPQVNISKATAQTLSMTPNWDIYRARNEV